MGAQEGAFIELLVEYCVGNTPSETLTQTIWRQRNPALAPRPYIAQLRRRI
jgi:hypothetical protein